MKKVLVLAYQISPIRGSEYSVAWNYVSEMSKDNELVVLYGTSGNHMGDFVNFDKYLNSDNFKNVKFISIKPNVYANKINILNKKKLFKYAFYFAYRIWQRQAYRTALNLLREEHFDLIHFLNPIGYREPGYLWKIDIPYIWGPISGIYNQPEQLFKSLSIKDKIFTFLKNKVNTFQFKHNLRLRYAIERTDLLIAATTENQKILEDYFNKQVIYLPENGILNSTMQVPCNQINLNSNDVIKIFWIGSVDSRKSLNILLVALEKVNANNWHLDVIGDGPKKISMQKLAKELKIDQKIKWHGQIPRIEVLNLLKSSHLHVITSLAEGNPTTLWEAMTFSVPTISLNHCGMKDVICEKCGVKINISSYEQVTHDIADVLLDLLSNPQKLNMLSKGVNECIHGFTWEKRRKIFNQFYKTAIKNWKQKKHI